MVMLEKEIKFPFQATPSEIEENLDYFIASVFSSLASEFLVMPKGKWFIEYHVFESGYEALKKVTAGFSYLDADRMFVLALEKPITLIVLRSMLGFSPPEWAYLTTQQSDVNVSQGAARSIDRKARLDPLTPIRQKGVSAFRLKAMIQVACELLNKGSPLVNDQTLHRLHKADTITGAQSIASAASMGVPYAMLLYERFLGRPFAGHRDSVSELVGDTLESAIEEVLSKAGVSFRKTKRAEKISGFDQTPDFIIPDEFAPQVVIEAKITEDDGTARDKVTRIQHLSELNYEGRPSDSPRYEVVACIGGRGFGVRREDMKKLLMATSGKVFTAKTLYHLIDNTRLKHFKTR